LAPENTRKLIKDYKDSYYSLESNTTLSHNIILLDRPMLPSNKPRSIPHSMMSSKKNPKP